MAICDFSRCEINDSTIPPVGRRMEEIVVEEITTIMMMMSLIFTEPSSRRWRLDEATR